MADIETIDTVQSTENDVHQRPKTSKSIILEERDEEEKVSKKPGNTAFKQQRLPAWQPILTAGTVLPMFFLVGIVFVPLGVGFLVTSNNVQEVILDYTRACTYLNETNGTNTCIDFYTYPENENSSCTCTMKFELNTKIEGPIYMYYRLTNYYQNHRRYVNSRDDIQLLGKNPLSASSDCSPYDQELRIYSNTSQERITYAPCGAIANSLFNDTFNITFDDDGELPSGKEVMLDRTNIAWSSDRRTKFRNPPGASLEEAFNGTTKPPNWQKYIWEMQDGYQNEDFIVWMRTAAFPTFRKLYGRVVDQPNTRLDNGLPVGNYTLTVQYNYLVHMFDGTKSIVLTTTSWLGGKNNFLGIAYIVTGSICIVFGAIFLIVHIKHGKKLPHVGAIVKRKSKEYGTNRANIAPL
ncbi:cell cycle control protein 50A-like isoform X2 [Lytechinus variegatus]|uniref:cell cycle control protein 50A-like isoform X2 n=1 Tax=Lytechinus variegatus TaxID=7654 RepID=UPI001BB22392|nr:cell cycle control protein 50A-like isoform X2 [Lytechinus variegatus]